MHYPPVVALHGAGMNPMHHSHRDTRGQSLVEFALIMPILFTLLFGIIEMGFLMRDYVSLTSAVRAGAHPPLDQVALGRAGRRSPPPAARSVVRR